MTTVNEALNNVRAKVGSGISVGNGECYALASWYESMITPNSTVGLGAGVGNVTGAIGDTIKAANIGTAYNWTANGWSFGNDFAVGQIVTIKGTASNIFGHVVIVEKVDASTVTVLEQNYAGKRYPVRNVYNRADYKQTVNHFINPPKSVGGSNTKAINHNGETYSGLTTHFNPNIMYSSLSKGVTGYSRMTIDRIVIHHNATTNKNVAMQTWYESSGNWTSAHYEVADNEIWGCVGEQYSAFHSGDATMNRRSIGIEHLNATGAPSWTISEGTYKSSAKLIADICKRYNIPIDAKHIIPHKQVSATECPGGIDMNKLIKMAQEVSRGGVVAKNTTTQKTSGSFRVKVSVSDLNIRKSSSLKSGKNGVVKPGVYTITETKSADGYEWGKLKSGAGWIALKYTTKL